MATNLMELLDNHPAFEESGAHPSQVYPIDGFMADFRLSDAGVYSVQ